MILKIKNRVISKQSPFIIAEAGINHNGDIKLAKELISKAKESGADCIKFQTYKTENLIIKNDKTVAFFNEIKRCELSYPQFEELKEHAVRNEILFMSTPDEERSLDFLLSLNIPAIKIGSGEVNNISFLRRAAQSKKVILLSTGASTEEEIDAAYNEITALNKRIILMHCVSEYPASVKRLNLRYIKYMASKYRCLTGFSDHTTSLIAPTAAFLMGASVIEKHFTLDNSMEGPDHKFSLNPQSFKLMVENIREAEVSLGEEKKKITPKESELRQFIRKSLFSKKSIKRNETLTEENTVLLRPQLGIKANEYFDALGCKAGMKINKFKPIYKKDISKK
ncbi:MAG: N-acetylneuraminate synthase family protein [bacterium]|nr:N-acetylneuraminate synthase family protein [bacterium]